MLWLGSVCSGRAGVTAGAGGESAELLPVGRTGMDPSGNSKAGDEQIKNSPGEGPGGAGGESCTCECAQGHPKPWVTPQCGQQGREDSAPLR